MKKKIQISLIIIQILAALIFFVAGWKADRALDKSGIGDPERFSYWNAVATHGMRAFLLSWIASIAVETVDRIRHADLTAKGIMKTRLPIYIIVPPSVVFVLWIISIL
jgi:hypothetical protein